MQIVQQKMFNISLQISHFKLFLRKPRMPFWKKNNEYRQPTGTALIKIFNDIPMDIDNHKYVFLAFILDLPSALDGLKSYCFYVCSGYG